MAFNLTANINARLNTGLAKSEAGKLKKLFGTQTISVKLSIPTASRVDKLSKSLGSLRGGLRGVAKSAGSASQALQQFNNTINAVRRNTANITVKANANIKQTTKSLQEASNGMRDFGKVSGLALRRFVGFKIAQTAVFGLTRSIASAASEALLFEKNMIKVSQVTGISKNNLGGLNKIIKQLSTGLGVSSSSLVEVSRTLSQAGLSIREVEGALDALAKSSLAATFGDITATAEGSIAIMKQFTISSEDLGKALGSINAVASKFAVESNDIISATKIAGGVFAQTSKGVASGVDALQQFISVFTAVRATTRQSAETIATGLRTIFTRVQRPQTIAFLRQMGIELQDIEGKFVGPFEAVNRLSKGLAGLGARDQVFANIIEELGGFRQVGKVIPLIIEQETRMKALAVAQQGVNSLTEDAIKAQEGFGNQLVKVKEEFIALVREITQTATFKTLTTTLLSLTTQLIDLASTLKEVLPILTALGAVRLGAALPGFLGGAFSGVRQVSRRSGGGPIIGGSGVSDDVLIAATGGEFVMKKSSVESIGQPALDQMNKTGKVLGFADGGFVGDDDKIRRRRGRRRPRSAAPFNAGFQARASAARKARIKVEKAPERARQQGIQDLKTKFNTPLGQTQLAPLSTKSAKLVAEPIAKAIKQAVEKTVDPNSNASRAASDKKFIADARRAGVDPSARQFSKSQRGLGAVANLRASDDVIARRRNLETARSVQDRSVRNGLPTTTLSGRALPDLSTIRLGGPSDTTLQRGVRTRSDFQNINTSGALLDTQQLRPSSQATGTTNQPFGPRVSVPRALGSKVGKGIASVSNLASRGKGVFTGGTGAGATPALIASAIAPQILPDKALGVEGFGKGVGAGAGAGGLALAAGANPAIASIIAGYSALSSFVDTSIDKQIESASKNMTDSLKSVTDGMVEFSNSTGNLSDIIKASKSFDDIAGNLSASSQASVRQEAGGLGSQILRVLTGVTGGGDSGRRGTLTKAGELDSAIGSRADISAFEGLSLNTGIGSGRLSAGKKITRATDELNLEAGQNLRSQLGNKGIDARELFTAALSKQDLKGVTDPNQLAQAVQKALSSLGSGSKLALATNIADDTSLRSLGAASLDGPEALSARARAQNASNTTFEDIAKSVGVEQALKQLEESAKNSAKKIDLFIDELSQFTAKLSVSRNAGLGSRNDNSALLSRVSGGSGISTLSNQPNVFKNTRAFSKTRIDDEASRIAGSLGGENDFTKSIRGVKQLQDELPDFLNQLSTDLQGQPDIPAGQAIETKINQDFKDLPEVLRNSLIGQLQGKLVESKASGPGAIGQFVGGGGVTEFVDKFGKDINAAAAQFVDTMNKNIGDFEKGLTNWVSLLNRSAKQFDAEVTTNISNQNALKELRGGTLTSGDRLSSGKALLQNDLDRANIRGPGTAGNVGSSLDQIDALSNVLNRITQGTGTAVDYRTATTQGIDITDPSSVQTAQTVVSQNRTAGEAALKQIVKNTGDIITEAKRQVAELEKNREASKGGILDLLTASPEQLAKEQQGLQAFSALQGGADIRGEELKNARTSARASVTRNSDRLSPEQIQKKLDDIDKTIANSAVGREFAAASGRTPQELATTLTGGPTDLIKKAIVPAENAVLQGAAANNILSERTRGDQLRFQDNNQKSFDARTKAANNAANGLFTPDIVNGGGADGGVASSIDGLTAQLSNLNIPEKIALGGAIQLDININGGEVLTSLEPKLQELITNRVRDSITNIIDTTTGETKPVIPGALA